MPDNEAVVETQEVPISEATTQAEYKAARKEGKSAITVAKAVEVEPEKPKEEETEQEPEAAEEKPKVRGGFQKKIDKLTKERAEWEARATAAERRAQELAEKGGKEAPKNADSDPEPQEADFTDVREYWKAIGRWTARQEMKAQKDKEEREEVEAQVRETWESYLQRREEAREEFEDFDEVVNVPTPWMEGSSADMAAAEAFRVAVVEDPNSGRLEYFYGSHHEDFMKLRDMTPAQIVKAVGRQSDKLSGAKEVAKPKLVSKAPPPIHPVSTGASKSTQALGEMESMAEYKKARRAGQKA